ncbi:MAG: hypothetical protein ACR2RB_13505 [Gammaproteobacteria bacterium]
MTTRWSARMAALWRIACLVPLLFVNWGCSTTPAYPVHSQFLGERVNTTVDSEIARYYLDVYLAGRRNDADFDAKIDRVYRDYPHPQPTRDDLRKIAADFSVDFAALFFADRLWADKRNQRLQETFRRFIERDEVVQRAHPNPFANYVILFVPGWDYAKLGHVTGANFAMPRILVTELGIENQLVEIPPNGSVEENADYLSKELIKYGRRGKKIIVVGASSAGPAIHLSIGEQLQGKQLQSIAAWVNIGGILRGSPLIDHYQQWPQRWLFNTVLWWENWDTEKVLSMSVQRSRKRFERLSLSDDVLVINYLGLSLSGQLGKYSRDRYPLLAPQGPNDGLTLLADVIAPGSITIIAMGSDHFFAEDPRIDAKTVALAKTVIAYLEEP